MTKLETREALLQAATEVFASKGYDGATVKDVAELAGVNVSLVSYHFDGKENLYRECLSRFGTDRLEATQRILQKPQSREDLRVRLRLFAEEFMQFHLRDPQVTKIIHRECTNDSPLIKDVFMNTFAKVFQRVEAFLNEGAAAGLIHRGIQTHYLAMAYIGTLVHATRMDGMHEEIFGTSLKDASHREAIIQTLETLLMEGTKL